MSAPRPPPLHGIRVVELAGLAPVPFTSMILADYGASVIRIDRPAAGAHLASSSPPSPSPSSSSTSSKSPPPRTSDLLTRHKTSICISLKSPPGRALLLAILAHADILLDPYRPGVLEKLDLSPSTLRAANPRLIVARLSGFRRDGKYAAMAGHDINYVAASGVLSMLGRTTTPASGAGAGAGAGQAPYAPGNLLADFAGGALGCAVGVLMALYEREASGRGQVVSSNMVDGTAYLATFLRFARKNPMWSDRRGWNVLDGGAPYYDTYRTKDGRYVSVGALEPQFYALLLQGLGLEEARLPGGVGGRFDKGNWMALRGCFEAKFAERTRGEWEAVFDGTDACVTPVLEQGELEAGGYEQRSLVGLSESPGLEVGRNGLGEGAWFSKGLRPGEGGVERLEQWTGWKVGHDFDVERDGDALVLRSSIGSKL